MIKIKVSTDFTSKPGGRYTWQGAFSGQQFREEILYPKYKEAILNDEKIELDLDDCAGIPTSFLEESIGGIVRKDKDKNISKFLKIRCKDRPDLIVKIKKYIEDAYEELDKE